MMDSNQMQALVDGMSAQWKKERAATQMTLGNLIDALENLSDGSQVENIINPHSYRGYYSDLAFEQGQGLQYASTLLETCRELMGRGLQGYKGGTYIMGEDTPLWISSFGISSQIRIMDLDLTTGMFVKESVDD